MAGTAWLAPSMPINASTHLRAAPPHLSTYPSRSGACFQSSAGRAVASIPIRHPPRAPPPHPNAGCRPAPPPGILELEVAVDDQLSEFCEGRIGGRCVRSAVGERRSERSRARRGRWVMQESGSGRVGIPRARAQGARLITWRSARL
uniref:Uncharacterized protein n=1 Tax=Saccharum officinarum TaxID=4547 RepID=A0A678T6D8_SACOF|nr:hypothetical protein SO47N09_000007 [Saccharum officinarum]